jgi:hypothetical protein
MLGLAAMVAACARPPAMIAVAYVPTTPEPATKAAPPPQAPPAEEKASPPELEPLLRTDPELASMLADATRRRMQVLVAVPRKDENGKVSLLKAGYRADAEYFYPASAVKLPIAVLALEKIEELRQRNKGRTIDLSAILRIRGRRTTEGTLRDTLESSLVVSDNDAHNRLFDLVGREEAVWRAWKLDLDNTRVVHPLGDLPERKQPKADIFPTPNRKEPIAVPFKTQLDLPKSDQEGLLVGTKHRDESGRVVDGPMDFTNKNRVTLADLQTLLVALVRPDLAEGPLPKLSASDREALVQILETLPSELKARRLGKALDDVHKPLRAAVQAELPDDKIRVIGKGGHAYGFVVENAYVVDETTGRSFFVAAAVYANDSGVGDDRYEYTTVAGPFVQRLGHVLARTLLKKRPKS